jgi:signal transduction histidine kinase
VISTLAGAGNPSEQIALIARDAAKRFDLQLALSVPQRLDIPGDQAEALLRITREAITNAGHHARASTVRVAVDVLPTIALTITDDGAGFDVETQTPGFGMTGMRERAEAIGATFTVNSAAGKGTTVRVEMA